MKTTVIIPDPVMDMARKEADRLNVSISQLVEDALRLFLTRRTQPRKLEPLPTWNGGPFLVDVSDGAALRDLLSAEKDARLYGPDRDTRPWDESAKNRRGRKRGGKEGRTGDSKKRASSDDEEA